MSVTIPLRNDLTAFSVIANLDGTNYTLNLQWNSTDSKWYLEVWDEQDATPLVGSQKLVANFPMAAYFTGRQPPGWLIAFDTSGKGIDPGIADLGQRVQLLYMPQSNVQAVQWMSGTSYLMGDLVLSGGYEYICFGVGQAPSTVAPTGRGSIETADGYTWVWAGVGA